VACAAARFDVDQRAIAPATLPGYLPVTKRPGADIIALRWARSLWVAGHRTGTRNPITRRAG